MKKIILTIVALTCNATMYPWIITNKTPFPITITTMQTQGPKLDSKFLEYLGLKINIAPGSKATIKESVRDAGVRSWHLEKNTNYAFTRTITIESQPPVSFSLQYRFFKKSLLLLIQLVTQPTYPYILLPGKPSQNLSFFPNYEKIAKIKYNKQKGTLFLIRAGIDLVILFVPSEPPLK